MVKVAPSRVEFQPRGFTPLHTRVLSLSDQEKEAAAVLSPDPRNSRCGDFLLQLLLLPLEYNRTPLLTNFVFRRNRATFEPDRRARK